jgi:hypothetical protein
MRQDDSDWVNDLFAAGARNWTPAAARHAGRVLYAPFWALAYCASACVYSCVARAASNCHRSWPVRLIGRHTLEPYAIQPAGSELIVKLVRELAA